MLAQNGHKYRIRSRSSRGAGSEGKSRTLPAFAAIQPLGRSFSSLTIVAGAVPPQPLQTYLFGSIGLDYISRQPTISQLIRPHLRQCQPLWPHVGWRFRHGGYNCFGSESVDRMQKEAKEYDLAFSFAGEHRQYVEQVKVACEALKLSVFYDRDKTNEWWGNNFLVEQRKIYISARYFVPFISSEYFSKSIPSDEFETALAEGLNRQDDYILPVMMGDHKAPPERLPSTTHYLRAENYSPAELAQELHTKVGGVQQDPQSLGEIVSRATDLRMPRITPSNFSRHREANALLGYLGEQIRKKLPDLESQGMIATIEPRDAGFAIIIEHCGESIAGLNIFRADGMGDATVGFRFIDNGFEGFSTSTYSGMAKPVFNKEKGLVMFKVDDYDGMLRGIEMDSLVNREELLGSLWGRLVQRIESRLN